MIFKVKQKASVNYWDKSVATNPSLNEIGGINTALPRAAFDGVLKSTTGEYNYNWPYDFFSLVELVKMDEEVEFTKSEVTTVATSVNQNPTIGTNLTQQGVQGTVATSVNQNPTIGTSLTPQGVSETTTINKTATKTLGNLK